VLGAVVLVILGSLAARLWLIGHRPLWFDELFTLWASRLPLSHLLAVLANDSGPPLWYVLEKPFVLAGERLFSSDALARLLPFAATLSLFAGALALPTRTAKLRYVLLCAASPLILLYSAEARAYSLLALLCFALFLFAAEARETPGRFAAIALLSAAALYTHYLALFAVGAAGVVAATEKRPRSALAVVAGALPFLLWTPVMIAQPRDAVAWMHEPAFELVSGIVSSLGGAGDIPHPFGPPLPSVLVLIGTGLALLLAALLARVWRDDSETRRASAFLVFFFGGVLVASLARPVAFAGRTEMAILPVWLWTIARAGDRNRIIRAASLAVALASSLSTVLLLAAPRPLSVEARALEHLEEIAQPGDVLFAGAHFYLPARLAADRGRLAMTLQAFPLEQAAHPGWSVPTPARAEDLAAVAGALDRASPAGRVFFQVPPSYRVTFRPVLAGRGVMRRLAESPQMLLAVWTPD
jgi:hypothetical protein